MAYARLDVHFDEHPKFQALELEHLGLLACMIAYANRLLTDGFVPAKAVRGFGQTPARGSRVVRQLVVSGVLNAVEGGFQIVGFADHNMTREEVLARRAANRQRQDKFRKEKHNSRNATNPDVDEVTRYVTRDKHVTGGPRNALRNALVTGLSIDITKDTDTDTKQKNPPGIPPAGGDTAQPELSDPKPKRAKATRLAEDWRPSPATVERFAAREHVDAMASFERFQCYWLASSGRNAAKLDWNRTFTNWVLEDIARGRAVPYSPPARRKAREAEQSGPMATPADMADFLAKYAEALNPQASTPRLLADEDADCSAATGAPSAFQSPDATLPTRGSERPAESKFDLVAEGRR